MMIKPDDMLNDTAKSILTELGIGDGFTSPTLERMSAADSRYLRDLKLNVAAVLKSKNLSAKEAALLALAAAVTDKHGILIKAFEQMAAKEGATVEEIAEAHACASLLGLNNVLYRFRHYMHDNEVYNKTPAGLRMNIMMSPVLGKEFFELLSLAISALNGCERCVTSHEHSVREAGSGEARIFDAIRLVSVIRSLALAL